MRERWLTALITACTTVDPVMTSVVHDDPVWHAECSFTRTCHTDGAAVVELEWHGSYDATHDEVLTIAWDWVHACGAIGLGSCDFTNCFFSCIYTP